METSQLICNAKKRKINGLKSANKLIGLTYFGLDLLVFCHTLFLEYLVIKVDQANNMNQVTYFLKKCKKRLND